MTKRARRFKNYDEPKSRSEIKAEETAMKRRWPISVERKAVLADQAFQIATDERFNPRIRVAAQRLLLAMEAMNQRDELGPDQLQVQVLMPDGSTMNAPDLLEKMRNETDYGMKDDRPIKAVPGSPEDYAD